MVFKYSLEHTYALAVEILRKMPNPAALFVMDFMKLYKYLTTIVSPIEDLSVVMLCLGQLAIPFRLSSFSSATVMQGSLDQQH